MIKRYKQFFEGFSGDIGPIKDEYLNSMKDMVDMDTPYYCLSLNPGITKSADTGRFGLNISYFTDRNVAGFGLGIRGRYYKNPTGLAADLEHNNTNEYLFRLGEEDSLINLIKEKVPQLIPHIDEMGESKFIFERVKKTRKSYCSADPDLDRKNDVYFELEDLALHLGIYRLSESNLSVVQPSVSTTTGLTKEVGLNKKQIDTSNQAKINNKVKLYNKKHGTHFYIKWKQVGQSNLYTWEIA